MKSAHKLAAALATLLTLLLAAYFIFTSLQSGARPPVPDQPGGASTGAGVPNATSIAPSPSSDRPEGEPAGGQDAVEAATTQQQQSSAPVALETLETGQPKQGAGSGEPSAALELIPPAGSASSPKLEQQEQPAPISAAPSAAPSTLTSAQDQRPASGETASQATTPAPPAPSVTPPEAATSPAQASPVEPVAHQDSASPSQQQQQQQQTGAGLHSVEPAELQSWLEFKRQFAQNYPNPDEDRRRLEVFVGNLRFINAFNRNSGAHFRLGVNKFAALTRDETNALFIGPPTNWTQLLERSRETPPPMRILPDQDVQASESLRSADWRNLTAEGPVPDQSSCKDSSIFAVVASLESTINAAGPSAAGEQSSLAATAAATPTGTETATATGTTASPRVRLSEQQIIDCLAYAAASGALPRDSAPVCSGGLSMLQVFDFLQRQAVRLASAQEYRELKEAQARGLAPPGVCVPPPAQRVGAPETRPKVGSFAEVHRDNIDEALLNSGPLVVALDASQPSFHFYKSGLYHELGCSSETANLHALLVAYAPATSDGDTNQAHYTARLSLGPDWGELGHVRLLKDQARNRCLPQGLAAYPNIAYD